MKIRSATPNDLDALFVLNTQISELHFRHAPHTFVPPSEEDRTFLADALADDARLVLIAEEGQQALGFITATITQNETINFLIKDRFAALAPSSSMKIRSQKALAEP